MFISEMSDMHLMNTIGLILARTGWRGRYMPGLLAELAERRKQGRCLGEEGGGEPEPRAVTR